MARPFPPTLHLDNQRAWRQGEDAVFLPIVYDLPGIKPANPDAIIIQITPPDLRDMSLNGLVIGQHEETPMILRGTGFPASGAFQETPAAHTPCPALSAELLSWEEKKKNLASLKRKAETGDFREPKQVQKDQAEVDLSFSDADPPKSKRLSKSVPLLLLGVLALVFFAWMAFR